MSDENTLTVTNDIPLGTLRLPDFTDSTGTKLEDDLDYLQTFLFDIKEYLENRKENDDQFHPLWRILFKVRNLARMYTRQCKAFEQVTAYLRDAGKQIKDLKARNTVMTDLALRTARESEEHLVAQKTAEHHYRTIQEYLITIGSLMDTPHKHFTADNTPDLHEYPLCDHCRGERMLINLYKGIKQKREDADAK